MLPDAAFLDRAFGNRPAVIFRTCLHLVVMNTAAMEALGRRAPKGIFLEADVFAILNEIAMRLVPEPASRWPATPSGTGPWTSF